MLGVGSSLRSDDAVGLRAAARVAALDLPGVIAVEGGSAPENATAEIRRLSPDTVIIVDAADMGEQPGAIRLIDPASASGVSFGTHGLSLAVLAGYLEAEIGCTVILVGIQPAGVEYGEGLSQAAEQAADHLARVLAELLAR